jgi:hypothetical protein
MPNELQRLQSCAAKTWLAGVAYARIMPWASHAACHVTSANLAMPIYGSRLPTHRISKRTNFLNQH